MYKYMHISSLCTYCEVFLLCIGDGKTYNQHKFWLYRHCALCKLALVLCIISLLCWWPCVLMTHKAKMFYMWQTKTEQFLDEYTVG